MRVLFEVALLEAGVCASRAQNSNKTMLVNSAFM